MEYLFDLKNPKRFKTFQKYYTICFFFMLPRFLKKNILIAQGNDFFRQLRILLYK